jgi:ABC-type multidrug transport system ATPase subunit
MNDNEIMIIDEKKVGVDNMMRKRIWKNMVKIKKDGKKKVIIKKNYIEEERKEKNIGMMRSGKMMDEEYKNVMIYMYG